MMIFLQFYVDFFAFMDFNLFMHPQFVEYVEKIFFPRIVEAFNKSSSGKSVKDLSSEFKRLDSVQIVTSFCLASFDCVDMSSSKFQDAFVKYLKEVSYA